MDSLFNIFIEPWTSHSLSVYWPIIAQGVLVSVSLGLIGCFLVVRGMALLGDALSHSVLPGIVVGFLIGGTLHSPWILIGATLFGMLAAVLVQAVHSQSRVKEDASLGIVFTALFALGVVMITRYAGQADLDPGCVLYGNIETFILQPEAIRPMAVVLGLILLTLFLFYRQILVATFDPALAVSLGIPAVFIHYAMMAALSLTVVASFEAVGAILAVALLIMPGATARIWSDRMPMMLLLAAGHGALSTVVGYWLSHEGVLNTSAAGAITVAGFALFTFSWLFAPRHGLITRAWQRRRLIRLMAMENLLKTIAEETGESGRASIAIEDLRQVMHLSWGRFRRVLGHAVRHRWIAREGAGLRLTPAGESRGRRLSRAHALWENYLQQEVGLATDHVHDAAEWIEHHLNDEKLQRIDDLLTAEGKRTDPVR